MFSYTKNKELLSLSDRLNLTSVFEDHTYPKMGLYTPKKGLVYSYSEKDHGDISNFIKLWRQYKIPNSDSGRYVAALDVNLKNRVLKQTYIATHNTLEREICADREERTLIAFFYKSFMETMWDWKNSHYWAEVLKKVTKQIYTEGLDSDIKIVSYDFHEHGIPDPFLDHPEVQSPMIMFFQD